MINGAQFLALFARPDLVLIGSEAYLPTFRLGIALAAVLTLTYAGSWLARWRFPLLLLLYCLLAGGLILALPRPGVDVWIFQQHGVSHLLQGENPYAATYINPYDHDRFHGPEILKEGRIQSCPYPPLSLLLVVPGYLAGDVRWSLLAALAGTAALAVMAGRRLGWPAGDGAELAVIAFLFTPAGFPLIQLGWTEPLMALMAAATLLTLIRGGAVALPLAGLLAVKQYGFLWLPGLAGRLSGRDFLFSVILAGLVSLPFLLWDARAFWFGVVEFQLHQPFRPDSLSISAAIYRASGWQLPSAVGLLSAALVAALVIRRRPVNGALAAAAVFLALVLFSKQAFLNYYWLVLSFLMLASVANQRVKPACESCGKAGL